MSREQCIFRREQRGNFTTIDNAILDTSKLSLGAIGLAVLILSKPPNWRVSIGYFASVCKEGERAISTMLKELATAGYIMRIRERNIDGTVQTVTLVADYPRYLDMGTPEERINGYTDPPVARGSDAPTPQLREGRLTEPSVGRGSVDGGVIVKTDSVKTNVVKTDSIKTDEESSCASHAAPTEVVSDMEPKHRNPIKEATPQGELFGAICEAIGWDSKTLSKDDKGQVAQTMGILSKADYTVADVRRFITEFWFNDWRWKKEGQHPTLKQLRQEIGKIRSVLADVAPPPKAKGIEGFRAMLAGQGISL